MVRLDDYSNLRRSDIRIDDNGNILLSIELSDDWWIWEKLENLNSDLQQKITTLLRKEKIEKIMSKNNDKQ